LIEINCPLCGSNKYKFVTSKKYPDAEYSVVNCRKCDFYFTNPEPSQTELINFYNSSYLNKHTDVWHEFEDKLNKQVAGFLVKEGIKSNLDIGSGQGRFVKILKDYGIDATGVEQVKESCITAKEKYGLELKNMNCEQYLDICSEKYDSITMLNVLEHIPNPLNIIKKTKKCLNNRGKLILVVPNVDFTLFLGKIRSIPGFKDKYMLDSKKFSQQGFDPPIHLSSFNKKTLELLLIKNDFTILKMTNAPVIKSSFLMNAFKNTIFITGKIIETVTFNKIIFGYSLLSISENK
jgi:SAM-dependent methyltransferase